MLRLKALLNLLLSYLPTKLPVGMAEFNVWADSIIELGANYADTDSIKFALASMVMHADSKHGALPKQYFVKRLRKVAANQVAGQVFQDVKTRQAEAQAKAAEETAKNEAGPSDGPQVKSV